uniref:SnoaL-like domain-containing protein n=1 Tax=Panagrolaimus sp. PS1159 TaxID=55785 RepID=A0AC35G5D2_9BILA
MGTSKELSDRLKIFQKRFERAFLLRDAKKIIRFYHKHVVIVGETRVITGRRAAYNKFKELFQTPFDFKITVTDNKEVEDGNRWIQKGFIQFKNVNEGTLEIKFEQQCVKMPNGTFLIDGVTNFGSKII